jgi:hypothetical protein
VFANEPVYGPELAHVVFRLDVAYGLLSQEPYVWHVGAFMARHLRQLPDHSVSHALDRLCCTSFATGDPG